MSSTKSSESQSFSGSGQAWARPFAKAGAGAVFEAYNRAKPTLDRAVGGTSQISNQLQGKFEAGQTQSAQARDYLSQVLGGNFLNANPHLDSIINSASGDIRDSVNSNYEGAGRYGSAYHDKAVADEIGNMSSNLRYGDLNNQMGRMDQAAQVALGSNNADAAQALGGFGQMGQLPYTGMNSLANSLAALFSGGTSKSVQYAPNPLWGALGAGLGAAGAYFSDRRLKRDIRKIGTRADGLNVYEWIYNNDPDAKVQTGYMADEVKEIYPDAFIENFNGSGYQGVNYALIPHESKLAA
jgi:HAMP domain-containing protein